MCLFCSLRLRPKVGNGAVNEFPEPSGPGAQQVENRVERESKSGEFNSLFHSTGAGETGLERHGTRLSLGIRSTRAWQRKPRKECLARVDASAASKPGFDMLGGRFGYFFIFFFCSGPGKSRRRPRRWPGGRFYLKIEGRGGGFPRRRRGRGKGAGGMSVVRGGGKYFFSGPKFPPSMDGRQEKRYNVQLSFSVCESFSALFFKPLRPRRRKAPGTPLRP